MQIKEWYTVQEVAKELEVTPKTIRTWIRNDLLYAGWDLQRYWIRRDEYLYFKRVVLPTLKAGKRKKGVKDL